ncbi:MAG: signal peptide peptidase SppA [Syntrophales bacterium]
MRRHPILFAFVLLIMMAMVFSAVVFSVSAISGKRKSLLASEKVGVVTVAGVITDALETVQQLEDLGKDDSVRAVVVRIDTPGGAVAPSQEIYGAVRELKKKKKVVASIGSIGASGGYLIACAADRTVANPGSITGSISTVMHLLNAEGLLSKIGLKPSVIKSGKYKDIGSPSREITAEEKALLQSVIDDMNDHFIDTIAADRKMPREKVKAIADGRIFSGRQAMQAGLVDELGDMNHAIVLAGSMSGMKGRPEAIYSGKKKSYWDVLFKNSLSALVSEWKNQEARSAGAYYLYE